MSAPPDARRVEAREWERGGGHDVAVARQVLGEERRLAVVAAEGVPEDDEREGPAVAGEGRVRAARVGRGRVPDGGREGAVGCAGEAAVRHGRPRSVHQHQGGLAHAVRPRKLEARAGARVADVGHGREAGVIRAHDATARVRCARGARAGVVGGILVGVPVERGVVDGRTEGPVGRPVGVRPAGEREIVVQGEATAGPDRQREAAPCHRRRDADRRTDDRSFQAGGGEPHAGGERGDVGENGRRRAAVRDPHRRVSGGRLAAAVELHVRGSVHALHGKVVARDGERR